MVSNLEWERPRSSGLSQPKMTYWSFIDPAAVEGSEQERSRAFDQVALQLTNRVRYFVILIDREQGEKT